jgi:hypothetical protein
MMSPRGARFGGFEFWSQWRLGAQLLVWLANLWSRTEVSAA